MSEASAEGELKKRFEDAGTFCVFEGTTHSVRIEEQLAFSDWINTNLAEDKDLRYLVL